MNRSKSVSAPRVPMSAWALLGFTTSTASALLAGSSVPTTVIPVKPPGTSVSARYVAVDPNHAGTVYATVYDMFADPYPPPGATVYKSTDSGTTWVEVGQSLLHSATLSGIAVDSQSTVFVNSSGDGVHRSTDGGQTWQTMTGGGHNIVADPATPGTIYAYVFGISKSVDGGRTWTDASSGLGEPLPGDPGPMVGALAIDPRNPSTLYAGRWELGIYKSTDGGLSWQPLDLGFHPSGVVSIAVDPTNSTVVFAGTAEDGLFKSADGGGHWARVDTGQPNSQFFALAIDQNSAIYAGVYDCCVLVSTDGGATWRDANPELHHVFITSLVADPSQPGTIYAGSIQ